MKKIILIKSEDVKRLRIKETINILKTSEKIKEINKIKNMQELIEEVLDFQQRCDESNCYCDYNCILEQWQDNSNLYVLDGFGILYTSNLDKFKNRNKNFFRTIEEWIHCHMYDSSKNILRGN